jgi:branched-chain amino acid transport system substrate-binding protein
MFKNISRLLTWLALACLWTNLWALQACAANSIVKIGVIGPFSGDMAYIGQGVRNGMTLALENLGPAHFQYQVVYEDNQLDARKTALALNKLVNVDKVDALVTVWSNAAYVAAPLATRNRLLHVSDSWEVKAADGHYNFGLYVAPMEQAKTFVEELKKRKIQSIGILSIKSAGTSDMVADTIRLLAEAKIKVSADETFLQGQRDFRTTLARIDQQHPQIYLISAFSPEIELIAKQFKEAGIKQPMTSMESFDETNDKSLFEGCWYVAPALPPPPFEDNYTKRFKMEMINDVPYVYDVIKLIVHGFESFSGPKKPTSTEVADVIGKMKTYRGITGEFQSDGHGYFHGFDTVKIIRGGKGVVIGQ